MEVIKKNKLLPRLRFKEFDVEWKSEKIGNVINNKSPKYNPEKAKESLKCIELEHLSSCTGVLLGYIDSITSASIKNKFSEGEILFGKLRPYLKKYLRAPFDGVCSSEIWVLKGENISNDFLYQVVQSDFFINLTNQSTGSKMPRADWNVVAKGDISIPSHPEQQKIAAFLSAVDEKIQLLTRKKELLNQYKKGVMQQLFSGKIRFKDEQGRDFQEWEEIRLGEICNITTGRLDANAMVEGGKYRFYTCAKDYFQIDDFAFDTDALLISGNGANVGYIHHYKGKFNAYQRTYVLDGFNDNINYLKHFLDQHLYKRIFKEKKEGNTPYIVMGTLSEMKISLPDLNEQKMIADFLSNTDNKLENLSTQIIQTQTFKKGLLQQMFV